MRRSHIGVICLVVLLAAGCSSGGSHSTSTSTSTATSAPSSMNAYCGTKTDKPVTSKVMVIYEENHDASSIYGSSQAPNINQYVADCGSARNYHALTHPSLPNYMASTSGLPYDSLPWTIDCNPHGLCLNANDNIFNQVGASGWKAYPESMTSNCQTTTSGAYAPRHNPAVYYTDLADQCRTNDVPMGTISSGALHDARSSGTLPTFSTVTPDLNNDMHDGTIQAADAWLASWILQIVVGPDYRSGRLVILVVWDEGSGEGRAASTAPLIVMSPYVAANSKSSVAFTHYSLLKAAKDLTGVPELAGAARANSLRTAFGF